MNEAKSVAPPAYYEQGATWENAVYRAVERSRAVWRIVAVLSLIGVIALAGAIALMMPLKSFEPYVIAVDKTTGFLEITRPLDTKAIPQEQAVTTANLVRLVTTRETYDPHTLEQDYQVASLLLAGDALKSLENDYASSNPNNRIKKYGRDVIVTVEVKSVSFLNNQTASVRFSTVEKNGTSETRKHWVSIVRFVYRKAPMANQWRFANPLGFQAVEYRRDQETIPEGAVQ